MGTVDSGISLLPLPHLLGPVWMAGNWWEHVIHHGDSLINKPSFPYYSKQTDVHVMSGIKSMGVDW